MGSKKDDIESDSTDSNNDELDPDSDEEGEREYLSESDSNNDDIVSDTDDDGEDLTAMKKDIEAEVEPVEVDTTPEPDPEVETEPDPEAETEPDPEAETEPGGGAAVKSDGSSDGDISSNSEDIECVEEDLDDAADRDAPGPEVVAAAAAAAAAGTWEVDDGDWRLETEPWKKTLDDWRKRCYPDQTRHGVHFDCCWLLLKDADEIIAHAHVDSDYPIDYPIIVRVYEALGIGICEDFRGLRRLRRFSDSNEERDREEIQDVSESDRKAAVESDGSALESDSDDDGVTS
jgi:hypothetical protein